MRLGSLLVFVLALAAVVAGQTGRAPQQPVFRAGTNLVIVDAYPRRNGKIVEGLKAADFEVYEDGALQRVEQLEFVRVGGAGQAAAEPTLASIKDPRARLFVLYLDTYHVSQQGSRMVQSQLIDLLQQAMSPADMFAVATSKQPMFRVRRGMLALADELGALGSWGRSDGKLPDPDSPIEKELFGCYDAGTASALSHRLRQYNAMLGLEQMVSFVGRVRDTRTFVVLVSDGWALTRNDEKLQKELTNGQATNRPGVGVQGGTLRVLDPARGRPPCEAEALRAASLDLDGRFRNLLEGAHRSNVTFYPLSPRGAGAPTLPGPPGTGVMGGSDALLSAAHETDGEALLRPGDLTAGLVGKGGDISAYYLLGYTPPKAEPDGEFHTIRVRVKTPGLQVSYRRGYQSPSKADIAATAALQPAVPDMTSDFSVALGRLNRERTDTPFVAGGVQWGDDGDLVIGVELTESALSQAAWTAGADVRVSVTGEGDEHLGEVTGRIEPGARATQLRLHPSSSPSIWRVEVRVNGRNTSATDRVLVRPSLGGLIDEPLLYRAAVAATSPLQPAVNGTFRRTERVHIEWPLSGVADHRSVRLLDTRGQEVALPLTLSDRDSLGKRTLALDATLAPLAPGDYVFELTATKGNDTELHFVAIRVSR